MALYMGLVVIAIRVPLLLQYLVLSRSHNADYFGGGLTKGKEGLGLGGERGECAWLGYLY